MPGLDKICQTPRAFSDWKQILWRSIQKLTRIFNFLKGKKTPDYCLIYSPFMVIAPFFPSLQ